MKTLRERTMDLLARREHSRHELLQKLVRKGFASEEVTCVIDQLEQEDLQSDTRFADAYVSYRSSAGFGPHRITVELQKRGVEERLIQQFVWAEALDWRSFLRVAWLGKFEQRPEFGTKAYASQVRFLMQRGFETESIHQLLNAKAEYSQA